MKNYKLIKSPIGPLTLVSEGKFLISVYFHGDKNVPSDAIESKKDPVLNETEKQLKQYFSGKLKKFNLPLKPTGTPFQLSVWKALTKIPYGKTWSYGEQAARIGDPKKARAVGSANGKNPLPIIVPCHRVIGKNGHLTGFGGGIEIKSFLLDLECEKEAKIWHSKGLDLKTNFVNT